MPYLRLPSGSFVEVPEGMSQSEALAKARQQFPDAFAPPIKPDTGFTGAAKASFEQLKADYERLKGRTGIKDVEEAEKEAQKYEKKKEKVFKSTEESWSEAPFEKFKETLGGSVPYAAAPLVLGGAAALGGAPVAVGTGLAGLASLGQFTGSFLSRQVAEGKQLKDTDLLAAGAAAVPAAALDVISFRMIPGIGRIFGAAGKEITPEMAKKIAEQNILKTTGAYALQSGKTAGIEGTTEAAQQLLERLQAGLSITDKEARDEYFESFIGGVALGGTLAVPGTAIRRGQIKAEGRRLEAEKEAKATEELAATRAAEQQMADIRAEQKPTEIDVAQKQANIEQTRREIFEQERVLKQQLDELRSVAAKETDVDKLAALSEQARTIQNGLNELNPDKLGQRITKITAETKALNKQLKDAEKKDDEEAAEPIRQQIATNNQTLDTLKTRLEAIKAVPAQAPTTEKLADVLKQINKARETGDLEALGRLTKKYKEMQSQYTGMQMPGGPAEQASLFEETKEGVRYPEYEKRMAEERRQREAISKDIVEQEQLAGLTEAEIAAGQRGAVKPKFKEDMTPEEYETYLVDKLVSAYTEPEKVDQKLTPEQRATEYKRVRALTEAKKELDEATARYDRYVAFAEKKAQAKAEGRGEKLYATPKEGRSLEVLKAGKDLQAVLDDVFAARKKFVEAIPKGKRTPTEAVRSSDMMRDYIMLDLTDVIDSMRKGERFGGTNPAMATGSQETKAIKARKLLDRYIEATVNNINFTRLAQAQSPLSDAERADVVDQIETLMGGKIQRATGKLAAQLKAGEPSPETAMRTALEKAGFKFAPLPTGEGEIKTGFSREEFKDVNQFIGDLKKQYTSTKREFGPLKRETARDLFEEGFKKDTGKKRPTDVEADDVTRLARKLDRVFQSDLTKEQRDVFEKAERMLAEGKRTKDQKGVTATGVTKNIPGLINSTEAQADRVLAGLEPDLRDIKDAITNIEEALATRIPSTKEGKQLPGGQMEFFSDQTATIRANETNFKRIQQINKFRREGKDVYSPVLKAFEKQKNIVTNQIRAIERITEEKRTQKQIKALRLAQAQERRLIDDIEKTKKSIAESEAQAKRVTGLGLPGKKREFQPQAKMQAALPHRYDKVQSPFNFARQFYKEMVERRSLTMNKKQQEAYKKAVEDYKKSRENLTAAMERNRVDSRIAKIMNSMVEMDDTSARYRKAENLILGIEEKLQSVILGVRPPTKDVEIKAATTPEEEKKEQKLAKDLGQVEPKLPPDEKAVGRISEIELAKVRKEKNDRFNYVKDRLDSKKAPLAERAKLVKELANLEKEIKAFDEVLNARRIGMIVGQAQEEQGAKRYKPTKTEKKMEKAGKFAKAGLAPEYYSTVRKALKDREKEQETRLYKNTPVFVRSAISQIAELQDRMENEKLTKEQIDGMDRRIAQLKTEIKEATFGEVERQEAEAFGIDVDKYRRFMNMLGGSFKPRIEAVAGDKRLDKAEAKKALGGVKIPKGLDIMLFDTVPEKVKEQARAQGYTEEQIDGIRGGVMPDGSVFVVSGTHADVKDFQRTLAHEITGHLGVETLLGEAGMTALAKRVAKQDGGVWALADKLGVSEEATATYAAAKRAGDTDEQAANKALREVIAHVEEARPDKSFLAKANEFIKALVGAVRAALRKMGVDLDVSTSDIYKILRDARNNFKEFSPGVYQGRDGEIQFSVGVAEYGAAGEGFKQAAEKILVQNKSLRDRTLGNNLALRFKQLFVSRSAGLEQVYANKAAEKSSSALQTKYYINMHDQRYAWTNAAMSNGVPKLRQEKGGTKYVIESVKGANLKQLAEILSSAKWGNAEGVRNSYSVYRIAKRAKRVGLDKLNFKDTKDVEKAIKALEVSMKANPTLMDTFKKADEVYDQYNKDLMDFLVQTGRISESLAKELTKYNDYIPFYRKDANGDVVLDVGGAPRVRVGNLKDQPYLHELAGDDERIVDIYTGALQNTSLLIDMALGNLATRNTAFSLNELGLVKPRMKDKKPVPGTYIRKGTGPASDKVIRFYVKPIDENDDGRRYVEVDTDTVGVPAEFVVQGLAGVNTSVPGAVNIMGIPARLLRTWVTRSPVYAARQVIRDPFIAVMASGVDTAPVLSSLREIAKTLPKAIRGETIDSEITRFGLISSNVFTGTVEDQQKMMLQLTGKSGLKGQINSWFAKADIMAMQGDAATRQVSFNNYRRQGLSEMEAILATHELMPFSQRGTSASLFLLSTMVPFLNAQIQGFNVLYKAFRGTGTFQDKLRIKQKLWQRGAMMFGATMLYALIMSEDEAYLNANDDERYNNWFVYVPGVDEPVRIPIPFELGIIFKALPEAIVNVMMGDRTASEAANALRKMVVNAVPLGPSALPQAVKAPIEVLTDYSFYTGRSIVGERLKDVDPSERFNQNTTEIAKLIGKGTGKIPVLGEYLSPVQIEYLVRGYTGGLPLALASLTNPVFGGGGTGGEKPEMRASDLPVFGSVFQPKDAGGLINRAYKDVESVERAKKTYNKLEEEGRDKDAEAYSDQFADILSLAPLAGEFRQRMGELAKEEREVKSDPDMPGAEKRRLLDEIRKERIELARDLISERE
jgi:hypothetical protein